MGRSTPKEQPGLDIGGQHSGRPEAPGTGAERLWWPTWPYFDGQLGDDGAKADAARATPSGDGGDASLEVPRRALLRLGQPGRDRHACVGAGAHVSAALVQARERLALDKRCGSR